jgi:hypothetical protein
MGVALKEIRYRLIDPTENKRCLDPGRMGVEVGILIPFPVGRRLVEVLLYENVSGGEVGFHAVSRMFYPPLPELYSLSTTCWIGHSILITRELIKNVQAL